MPRRLRSLAAACVLLASSLQASASADLAETASVREADSAHAAIKAIIEVYFEGHATGDPGHMREAFLPGAHIEGIRDGRFTSWTVDEYCALFDGEPAADEDSRIRTIDFIDVAGNAALAKATLVHGQTVFTDYFVLLEVDGEWRIANKVYYGHRN